MTTSPPVSARTCWLSFSRLRMSPPRLRRLIAHFGTVEAAWSAAPDALRATRILDERAVMAMVTLRSARDDAKFEESLTRLGITTLLPTDDQYPVRLREITDPPYVLYMRGSLSPEDVRAIGIAGTRTNTPYGRDVTRTLTEDLVRAGITIVGGLSAGIEFYAHFTALAHSGRTIAVLPCGLDQIFPKEHTELAARIATHGALLSEHAPGVGAERFHFVPRNRLISGLSAGVVVVEAGETSGAISVAGCAIDQGREVFAVPGAITSVQSVGTNRLIQDGATLVLGVRDILDVLFAPEAATPSIPKRPGRQPKPDPDLHSAVRPPRTGTKDAIQTADADVGVRSSVERAVEPAILTALQLSTLAENETETKILQALAGTHSLGLDELSQQTAIPAHELLFTLTALQLRDLIHEDHFQRYTLMQ